SQIQTTVNITPEAGKPIVVKAENALIQNMYFDGYELTEINARGKRLFFGVISLYNSADSLFTQITKPQTKSIVSHPTQKIYLASTKVLTKDLNNPAHIRIPASFLKKQEDEKDQIAIERSIIKSALANDNPLKEFCFDTDVPINSKRVSKFGSFRRLPNGYKYF